MSESAGTPQAGDLPAARIAPARRWFSWAWLAPLAALAVAAALLVQASRERGTVITVRFSEGAGVKPGDALQYRGVQCGQVRGVELAPNLAAVLVRVELDKGSEGLAREGSRFWIVKPEVSVTRVRGLETLLGPRYLECEPGSGPPALVFEGLGEAPARERAAGGGLMVIVEAGRRGSVSLDSPVVYRGVRVGSVEGFELAPDGTRVEIAVRIEPRFARLVRSNTKFWDAGGIGLDIGLMSGFTLQTGSLETVLAGGIAFATPTKYGEAVESGHRFALDDRVDSEWLKWEPVLPESGENGTTAQQHNGK
jgi:paraquat-inducible protein B